jgi:MFS family permease
MLTDPAPSSDDTAPTPDEPGTDVPLRRNSDFRKLWIGGVVSQTGTEVTQIAFPLLILAATGSAAFAGLLTSGELAVYAVTTLPAGLIADRFHRRGLLVFSDFTRAVLLGGLTVCVLLGWVHVALVIAVAMTVAVFDSVFGPAQDAALKELVPESQLTQAATTDEARLRASRLVGPLLGGWLFAFARWVPFLGDAVSYVVSGLLLGAIRKPLDAPPGAHDEGDRLRLRDALAGFRFVLRNPFLRVMAVMSMGMTFTLAGFSLIFIASLDKQQAGSAVIGLALGAYCAAGLLGALLAPHILRVCPPHLVIIVTAWVIPVVLVCLAVISSVPFAIASACLLYFCIPSLASMSRANLVAITPSHLQGRVSAALMILGLALSPIAPTVFGVVFDSAGRTWAFAGMACAGLVAALPSLTKPIRTVTARTVAGPRSTSGSEELG